MKGGCPILGVKKNALEAKVQLTLPTFYLFCWHCSKCGLTHSLSI